MMNITDRGTTIRQFADEGSLVVVVSRNAFLRRRSLGFQNESGRSLE